ncbi:zinc finger BED domain-containing protein DAYSLEEPER [Cajanus cajan]|nr:zinc finger BED domain-containing protein DAYSLEEPER [Cajanus cajan]XP_020226699.1 zinc finger BED domain-containing protein DAYSLEEPER [Cajanus cajan]
MVDNLEEDKVAVTPDMENDRVDTDALPSNDLAESETLPDSSVEKSESEPNKDLSNWERQQNKELAASETLATNGEAVTLTNQHLVTSEEPAIDNPEICESLTSNQPGNAEASQISQIVNSEAPHTNQSANSEALSDSQFVRSEAPLDKNIELLPSHAMCNSETQTSNGVVVPETQHGDEVVMSDTVQGNEGIMSETQQSNVVMSEPQPENELANPITDSNNRLSHSEIGPDNQFTDDVHMIPEDQLPQPESLSHSEPLTNSVPLSDTQTCNDVVMSEPLPENELANSITDPNNQLSHSETGPDNHFTNLHMIPEDQLPQPESLPHSEPLPDSEPQADTHLTDIKAIYHTHLTHYDTLPNNHADQSEALSLNQLSNSEALSHDQLVNPQMLPHYELENSETMHHNQMVNSQANYEMTVSNAIPSYEIINAETPLGYEDRIPETQPTKRRKKKSIVWEHFTIETVSPGCRRACCKQCAQTFAYSTGSKVAGTSHLKRHIAKGTCSALLRNNDPNQLTPYTARTRGSGAGNASDTPKRRYRSPSTPYIIFDQDQCRHDIARMIIMHDYPLHMVEHPGFVAFVQNLQPQFKMVTFNSIQGDCVATYLMEKQHIVKYIEGLPGRVCLTLDIWTSSQSLGYVFITGHFVDHDWKLQRRILNVVMEPYPDSDSALTHAVAVCLSDWGLEGRLFSVTCNQALSNVALENLRPLLSVKNPLILNGQLLVGNCIARTLSSVAKELLGSAEDLIKKIRDSVKYVKTSESHEEKFLELKQHLQVPCERSLFIDDEIQWNTSYQMLVAASEMKEVFSCLDTSDPDYKGAPSMQDWKRVEILCSYLKPLFDAANILTTTTHPTAITFFHEVWKLQLDATRAVTSEDPFISRLNKIMHEKIDKYWRECSLVLALAVVMDPRFKMKLVEFSFTKIYGEDAHVHIKTVDDGIHELFHEYVALPLPLTPAYAEDGGAGSHSKMEESPVLTDNGLTDFDAYIKETTSQHMRSELDQYLEESLLPRVPDFDVLGWWKLNKLKYPTLSKMARDILSVPVSTVAPDSVFYSKSKEMDRYRSSLRPETVEALVCAKDWLQYGTPEASNALVQMIF